MDRNQTVRIAPSSISANGISLSEKASARPEMLLSGLVTIENGNMKPFHEVYPFIDLVSEMRWSDMNFVRSATCGPLSCLLIEGPQVAGTQVLMVIPLAPASVADKSSSLGASRLRDELAHRINLGKIKCVDGDLRWITDSK
jgi:hypothetical protein